MQNEVKEGWRERFDRLTKEGRYFINTLIGGVNLQRTKIFCEDVEKETEQRVVREWVEWLEKESLDADDAGHSQMAGYFREKAEELKHHYNITE